MATVTMATVLTTKPFSQTFFSCETVEIFQEIMEPMDNAHYKVALIEKIIGWLDGVLVIFFLILIRECDHERLLDISAFQHIIYAFQHINFTICEICQLLVLFFIWNFISYMMKITRLDVLEHEKWRELVSRISVSVTIGASMVILFAYLLRVIRPSFSFTSALLGLFFWGLLMALFLVNKMSLVALLRWLRRRRPPEEFHHALIVGATNPRAISLAANLSSPDSGYSVIGLVDDISDDAVRKGTIIEHDERLEDVQQFFKESLSIVCSLDEFEEYISKHRVDEIFITLPIRSFYDQILTIIKACGKQGIKTYLMNDLFGFQKNLDPDFTQKIYIPDYQVGNLSSCLIDYNFVSCSASQQDVKRLFDITASLLALIMLSPVFVIVTAVIYFDDGWPIFFAQERVGLNKRRFKMHKFRTMVRNAEKLQAQLEAQNEVKGAAFKITRDPRITKSGKLLRKTSLDEIPQFANVLIGNMSIVGPRPLPIRDFEKFYENAHRRRFSVKPGITGLWQVNGRNEIDFEEWMKQDLEYVVTWNFWVDFKIMLKTILVVLQCRGAK